MYYYANLEKRGEEVIITGVSIMAEPVNNGYCITKKQATDLKDHLLNPQVIVKAAENYQESFDWEVIKRSPLEVKKLEAKYKVQEHYNNQMNTVALFEMYNVMLVNTELASKGYFITDENREEKYIEIINSGNEKLIVLLQSYLEMKDRIDPMWEYYNKFKEFKTNLEGMKTIEEIDTAVENLCNYIQ